MRSHPNRAVVRFDVERAYFHLLIITFRHRLFEACVNEAIDLEDVIEGNLGVEMYVIDLC